VFVADYFNNTIRKVSAAGVVTTLAGSPGNEGSADGTGSAARFRYPSGIAVDSTSNVYVADAGNHTIRKVTPAGVVTTLAGSAGVAGSADGTGSAARFNIPSGVAVDSVGNVYVADTGNHTIRKVTATGVVTTIGGSAGIRGIADGTGSAALFNAPDGVAVDSADTVYVADTWNHRISKGTPGTSLIGSLTVTISPSAAVSAGAQWQADGGAWQTSGATVSELSVGSHTVHFKPLSGWSSPSDQSVTINSGSTTTASGTYTSNGGTETVTWDLEFNGADRGLGRVTFYSDGTFDGWGIATTEHPGTFHFSGTWRQMNTKSYAINYDFSGGIDFRGSAVMKVSKTRLSCKLTTPYGAMTFKGTVPTTSFSLDGDWNLAVKAGKAQDYESIAMEQDTSGSYPGGYIFSGDVDNWGGVCFVNSKGKLCAVASTDTYGQFGLLGKYNARKMTATMKGTLQNRVKIQVTATRGSSGSNGILGTWIGDMYDAQLTFYADNTITGVEYYTGGNSDVLSGTYSLAGNEVTVFVYFDTPSPGALPWTYKGTINGNRMTLDVYTESGHYMATINYRKQ